MRRSLTLLALFFGLIGVGVPAQDSRFDAFEKTIPELQAAMTAGEVTSRELVLQYLERIEAFDRSGPRLNSVAFINPRALDEAEALDHERAEKGARGPLHGIPILLKDNYGTFDMTTSAGSPALAGFVPAQDATQVRRLREAGVVILGKVNMHELARGITNISGLWGQTLNPYDPERNPGGSSGGTGAAIAANFAAVGMGSDTCGSIRIPSANNNLFGLRVTQGLSSRHGIIPLSHTQDVGGPLARSVVDLALVLDATVGPDAEDPQTSEAGAHVPPTFTSFLDATSLAGVRVGLLKPLLKSGDRDPEKEITEVVMKAVEVLKSLGAETVDLEFEEMEPLVEASGVIGMEFKDDFKNYLEAAGNAPVKDIDEVMARGLVHESLVPRLLSAPEKDPEKYQKALSARGELHSKLIALLEGSRVDVIAYPTLRLPLARVGEPQSGSTCALSAQSGLPAFSLPAGFTEDGLPVGLELLGREYAERDLVRIGAAYERAAQPRKAPSRTPSLLSGSLSASFALSGSGDQMSPSVQSEVTIAGRGLLDRSTQVLSYELQYSGVLEEEIHDIRLHRGAKGSNGPILSLLGTARNGKIPIRNRDLEALEKGELYIVMYTRAHPLGEVRAQILPLQ